jgi:hypothetical protein
MPGASVYVADADNSRSGRSPRTRVDEHPRRLRGRRRRRRAAAEAKIQPAISIAADADGDLYVSDTSLCKIKKIVQ